jgi:transposase
MSLKPNHNVDIPVETARVAHAIFPQGNAVMRLRDELGCLYAEEQFADLFPANGHPAESPVVLAWVLVFQFMEGLTDRQAAEAVRSRIDWKYALGLELTDPGFDFSILCEFRARLIDGHAETRLLDTLLTAFQARGLLKARSRQRTDSTHVLSAVRDLNRLERVGETLRHVLNECAKRAPTWLKAVAPPDWYPRYAKRFDQMHLPKAQTERDQLAEQIGRDGYELLNQLTKPDTPADLPTLPCVELLRTVWSQQYHPTERDGVIGIEWRKGADLPPAEQQIESPYDPETHYCTHNATDWKGYKVHFTETCDEDADLHLITHVETTLATRQDVDAPAPIHQALAQQGLLPSEHLMDAGYVDADLVVEANRDYGIDIVGPITQDVSWQARENTGYDLSQFVVDWETQRVTCPHGQHSVQWWTGQDRTANEVIHVAFDSATCQACPARPNCTRSQTRGRSMQLRPRQQHEAIQRLRAQRTTNEFKQKYQKRSGIEGTISQAVRAFDARRTRYIGLAKTHLQMVATAIAINLSRFCDYLFGARPIATRTSPFAALAA